MECKFINSELVMTDEFGTAVYNFERNCIREVDNSIVNRENLSFMNVKVYEAEERFHNVLKDVGYFD